MEDSKFEVYTDGELLGSFNTLTCAMLFAKAYFNEYFLEPELELKIVRVRHHEVKIDDVVFKTPCDE